MKVVSFKLIKIIAVAATLLLVSCGDKKDGGAGAAVASTPEPAKKKKKTPIEVCREKHEDSQSRNACYQASYQKEVDSCTETHISDREKLNECYEAVRKRYNTGDSAFNDLNPTGFQNGFYHPGIDPFYRGGARVGFHLGGGQITQDDCRQNPWICYDQQVRMYPQYYNGFYFSVGFQL